MAKDVSLSHDLFYGTIAGVIGAACMTPVRLAARRAGLAEKMVPQAIEEALAARARAKVGRFARRRAQPPTHHAADQMLHLGFGAALGAVYGLATRRHRASFVGRGLLFGSVAWLFGSGVVVPLLGAARPLWRARPTEQAVNLLAHLIYGLSTALVADEMRTQTDHGPTPDWYRHGLRVG